MATNVISFNGVEIPDFLKVTGITFPTFGEVSVQESEVPRRLGNIDRGVKIGGKSINVTVKAIIPQGSNLHDMSDQLKRWLKGDNNKPSRLTFGEQPSKYVLARVSNAVTIEDLFLYGESEIEFYSADPLKYSSEIVSKSFSGNQGQAYYEGIENAPILAEIVLNDDYSELTLVHEPSFKEVTIQGTLQTGQTVALDSDRKLVQVDGVTDMTLLVIGSEWPYMEEGTNTFTVRTDKTTENTFTVSYRQID